MKPRKTARILAAAALVAAQLFADEIPPLPVRTFIGCINGKVNLWIGKDGVGSNFWFQAKGALDADSSYATVAFTKNAIDDISQIGSFRSSHAFSRDADFVGAMTFRVACTNAVGEHAGWVVAGTVTNIMHHVGVAIGVTGNQAGVNTKLRVIDGIVSTYGETSPDYAGTSNLYYGVDLKASVEIGRIRYAPRQTEYGNVGKNRMGGNVFEVASQSDFSDAVQIGVPVPDDLVFGCVLEMALDAPVTARYVRVKHCYKRDKFLTIAEIEACPRTLMTPINLSISPSDITNMYADVAWSVPAEDQCATAVVERAYSPAGPFVEISGWSDATAGGTCRDSLAPVGVPCYYRVKTWCEGGLSRIFTSDTVSYMRSRRLERDPLDLSALRSGVSTLNPWVHLSNTKSVAGANSVANAFDGDSTTFSETTCYTNTVRMYNPAIGVDFGEGAAFHLVGTYLIPRPGINANLNRPRVMAMFGAYENNLSDRCQLSPQLGGFVTDAPQYNFATNTTDSFRRIFLMAPNDSDWTYGNVAEVGFYGFTDQDVIDSGVLVPPPTVSCATNDVGVALTWEKAWNAESLRVERRLAGADGAWAGVASLASSAVSFVDETVPRSGTWEWRVTAVAGAEEISSLPCSCSVKVSRGLVISIW